MRNVDINMAYADLLIVITASDNMLIFELLISVMVNKC